MALFLLYRESASSVNDVLELGIFASMEEAMVKAHIEGDKNNTLHIIEAEFGKYQKVNIFSPRHDCALCDERRKTQYKLFVDRMHKEGVEWQEPKNTRKSFMDKMIEHNL